MESCAILKDLETLPVDMMCIFEIHGSGIQVTVWGRRPNQSSLEQQGGEE